MYRAVTMKILGIEGLRDRGIKWTGGGADEGRSEKPEARWQKPKAKSQKPRRGRMAKSSAEVRS
jgi:hypothetical protein